MELKAETEDERLRGMTHTQVMMVNSWLGMHEVRE